MTDAAPFTQDEIKRLRALLEVEDIRKVRLLYSQLLDQQQVDLLAELFTEDALCEFGPYGEWRGRETIRTNYKAVFSGDSSGFFHSMHNSSNHWVELTSATTAVGRSYLIDVVTTTDKTENPIIWLGVYDEDYRKVQKDSTEEWQIARCSLQFLWPERHIGDNFTGVFPGKA